MTKAVNLWKRLPVPALLRHVVSEPGILVQDGRHGRIILYPTLPHKTRIWHLCICIIHMYGKCICNCHMYILHTYDKKWKNISVHTDMDVRFQCLPKHAAYINSTSNLTFTILHTLWHERLSMVSCIDIRFKLIEVHLYKVSRGVSYDQRTSTQAATKADCDFLKFANINVIMVITIAIILSLL